jgi:cytochrome c-type biogenesis protein CcmH/NrfG
MLSEAVRLEDKLAYNEPSDMLFPTRHLLGAALLDRGRATEAEKAYRKDLKLHPRNGWALYGLAVALAEQKRDLESRAVRQQFGEAWRNADLHLTASAF